jgi:hypothetical protein
MHELPATSRARINPRLSSSRTEAASNTVRWPTRASTRGLTVLKLLVCLAAVVLPIVTPTTAALADDDKTYVGAECRPIDPANDPILLKPDNGTMLNSGQRDQTWICPVVRDSVDKQPEFARITVIESSTNRVTCTFEARDTQGGPVTNPPSASPDKRENVPSQAAVLYSYGSGENVVLSNAPFHGYYYFKCNVPGRNDQGTLSGVVTYIVTEQD